MTDQHEVADLVVEMEAAHPGFRESVEAERRRLYADHPDPDERRQFLLSHLVCVGMVNDQ